VVNIRSRIRAPKTRPMSFMRILRHVLFVEYGLLVR